MIERDFSMRSMFCLLAFTQGRDHLSVNSVVIHLLVNTTVGEDHPPSDGKVSEQMDAQIKHNAAVRLQQAEVCRLPPPSTDLLYREHAVWVRRGESELQLIQTEEKKHRMKESIRGGRLNVKGRLNQFVLQKIII